MGCGICGDIGGVHCRATAVGGCSFHCTKTYIMQPNTSTSTKQSVRSIGEYISREYYQYLIEGFAAKHPTEQRSVYIAKEFITAALAESPEVCGIRFMYGQRPGADPRSRTVLLMACYEKVSDNFVPNLSFPTQGHLTHEGDRVSTEECFAMFDRHVDRMMALLPGEARKEIPRGCYYGADVLLDLLGQAECAGIRFHFGYNAGRSFLPERYEVPLEAVDATGLSLESFVEAGQVCPPTCGDGGGGGFILMRAAMNMDLLIGGANGGALFEMYHHVSPALVNAMQKQGVDHRAVYAEAFAGSFLLLSEGRADEAGAACKRSLQTLMKKYLINN